MPNEPRKTIISYDFPINTTKYQLQFPGSQTRAESQMGYGATLSGPICNVVQWIMQGPVDSRWGHYNLGDVLVICWIIFMEHMFK